MPVWLSVLSVIVGVALIGYGVLTWPWRRPPERLWPPAEDFGSLAVLEAHRVKRILDSIGDEVERVVFRG